MMPPLVQDWMAESRGLAFLKQTVGREITSSILPGTARPEKKAWAVWDNLYRHSNSCAHPSSQRRLSRGCWTLLWHKLPRLPEFLPQHIFSIDHCIHLTENSHGIPYRAPPCCGSNYEGLGLLHQRYHLCTSPGWQLKHPWLRSSLPTDNMLLLAPSQPARLLQQYWPLLGIRCGAEM